MPVAVEAAAWTDAGPLSAVVTASVPLVVVPAARLTFSGLEAPMEKGLTVAWTATGTACCPLAGVMPMVALVTPVASRLAFTATLTTAGVVPFVGVTVSHPGIFVMLKLTALELETCKFCDGGLLRPE